MKLFKLTYSNIPHGSFAGAFAFHAEWVEGPGSPRDAAELTAKAIRSTLKVPPYRSILSTGDAVPCETALRHLRELLPETFIIMNLTQDRLTSEASIANWTTLTTDEWLGTPADELILRFPRDGQDPTKLFTPGLYKYHWVEKTTDASPEQVINFCLTYPKFRLLTPAKVNYYRVVYNANQEAMNGA